MFRKLTFCSFLLVVAAMAAPASAIDPNGTYHDGQYPGQSVLINVDIDAYGHTGPNDTQVGWTAWEMSGYYGPIGSQVKDFGYGSGLPLVTIDGMTATGGTGQLHGSRDRLDGVEGEYDGDLANVHSDLVYVSRTASGMGKDYIKVTFDFGSLRANYNYDITLLGWDPIYGGSELPEFPEPAPDGNKWAAWSTTNPDQWLIDNGYDPNGYGFSSTSGESNMPAGLMALVGDTAPQHGRAPWVAMFDAVFGMTYASTVNVTLDENGIVTLYGWLDSTSELGSQHIAFNGFAISAPEPATLFLLGLGGLFLRKKRE